jgi:hypothetical protein
MTFAGEVQPALAGAAKAASGVRNWSPNEKGVAGSSFGSRRYQLGGGACVQELEQMVARELASGAHEPKSIVEVRRLTEVDAAKIDATFDAWVRGGKAEERAVAGLSEQIAAAGRKHHNLQLFVVKGGLDTARNAGVSVVDPGTREAIWFFGRAVRISAHRRDAQPR